MMLTPSTYNDWSILLRRFANNDDSVLEYLENGHFEIDEGTVYRFYERVQETYVARKKLWIQKFNILFTMQNINTDNELAIILRHSKSNLLPISKFIKLKAFPDDLKETLKNDFTGFISDTKKNLIESVKREQPGNERILLIVNQFDFYETQISETKSVSTDTVGELPNNTFNRKIIL